MYISFGRPHAAEDWSRRNHTTAIKRAARASLAALLMLATLLAGRASTTWAAHGTVVAWGDHTSGEASVPAGLSDVKAIAAVYKRPSAQNAGASSLLGLISDLIVTR
jgi:hypothetical protein